MTEPQSRILRVIAEQRAALLRRDADTLRHYVNQWQQVEDALADRIELLARDMADRSAKGLLIGANKIYTLERFQQLLAQTQQQVQNYAHQIAPQIETEQQRLWEQGQIDAGQQIASIIGSFNRLPIQATDTIIGTTADGSPLLDVLRSNWPHTIDGIMRELVRGVALGANLRVVARRAAVASQASLKRMLTVARTEQLRAYRESSRELYNRSGVVKRYMRMAAHQPRTCPACIGLDRTIYSVDTLMPTHPNCRCVMTALIDGYNINYGKTAQEWFSEQSADVQRGILGKSGYNLWKSGEVSLRDFATIHHDPDWGNTIRVTPLSSLTLDPLP